MAMISGEASVRAMKPSRALVASGPLARGEGAAGEGCLGGDGCGERACECAATGEGCLGHVSVSWVRVAG